MSFLNGKNRSVREKDLYSPKPEPPSFMAIDRLADELADEVQTQNGGGGFGHTDWQSPPPPRAPANYLAEIASLLNRMPYGDMMELVKGVDPDAVDLAAKLHQWAKAKTEKPHE
jgi:hypothetical protein